MCTLLFFSVSVLILFLVGYFCVCIPKDQKELALNHEEGEKCVIYTNYRFSLSFYYGTSFSLFILTGVGIIHDVVFYSETVLSLVSVISFPVLVISVIALLVLVYIIYFFLPFAGEIISKRDLILNYKKMGIDVSDEIPEPETEE